LRLEICMKTNKSVKYSTIINLHKNLYILGEK